MVMPSAHNQAQIFLQRAGDPVQIILDMRKGRNGAQKKMFLEILKNPSLAADYTGAFSRE